MLLAELVCHIKDYIKEIEKTNDEVINKQQIKVLCLFDKITFFNLNNL